jgi:hypothetical protein
MSKYVKGFIACLVLILVMGATTYRGDALRTDSFGWETLGETTTAYTTPAVTERDYTNLAANHTDAIIKTITPYRYNNIGLRFIVDDDGDDTVFDLFASKGQDYFNRVCTITLKGGTVSGPGTSTDSSAAVFCDTLTLTNSNWITAITAVDGGGADRQSTVWLDLNGYDTLALVGTTVDDTTLVQITGH